MAKRPSGDCVSGRIINESSAGESRVAADPEQGASSDEKITPHHFVQGSPAHFVQRLPAIRGERSRYSVTLDAGIGQVYHERLVPGQC